jgi:hypothetical protein
VTRVLMHRGMRYHPLVGFGLSMRRRANPSMSAYNKGDAWIYLNTHDSVVQIIPGLGNNVQSIDLVDGGWLPNVAAIWNWKPTDARRWISSLASAELVTDRLASSLFSQLDNKREPRAHIPKPTRAAVLAKTSGCCVYCGTKLALVDGLPNSYRPDHVLPVARGGSDDVANLIPSCRSCNGKKGAKTVVNIWRSA